MQSIGRRHPRRRRILYDYPDPTITRPLHGRDGGSPALKGQQQPTGAGLADRKVIYRVYLCDRFVSIRFVRYNTECTAKLKTTYTCTEPSKPINSKKAVLSRENCAMPL